MPSAFNRSETAVINRAWALVLNTALSSDRNRLERALSLERTSRAGITTAKAYLVGCFLKGTHANIVVSLSGLTILSDGAVIAFLCGARLPQEQVARLEQEPHITVFENCAEAYSSAQKKGLVK